MEINLDNKGIIITGASKGLGLISAQLLANENARLVLMSRSLETMEEHRKSFANPDNHLCLKVDLDNPEEIKEGINKAKTFLNDIDAVIHVAGGGLGLRDPIINGSDFDKLYKLNLRSIIEINSLILPEMIKQGKGNIVLVGSVASTDAVASVGYNTVKAALSTYVRSLGNEMARYGIIITGILPGGFIAPGNSWERLSKDKPEVVENFIKQRLPRGFLGKAEEIFPLICWLCSDKASMMSGCMVPIDAGEGKSYIYP